MRHVIVMAVAVVFACRLGEAAVIDVGVHVLLPNTAGQQIVLRVSGAEQVTGFNLRAQLGDGLGPLTEPVFQAVSFTGGIWDAYPTMLVGGPVSGAEQFAQASVLFQETGREVPANGLLITLTINTTGFSGPAAFPLWLSGTQIGANSDFIPHGGGSLAPVALNGAICIGLLPGDADRNGTVGPSDLVALEAHFGQPGAGWAGGDFNLDGQVDAFDYLTLKSNYGQRLPSGVPGPASVLTLGLLLPGLLVRRRSHCASGAVSHGQ
jgi:hypothetical protein